MESRINAIIIICIPLILHYNTFNLLFITPMKDCNILIHQPKHIFPITQSFDIHKPEEHPVVIILSLFVPLTN